MSLSYSSADLVRRRRVRASSVESNASTASASTASSKWSASPSDWQAHTRKDPLHDASSPRPGSSAASASPLLRLPPELIIHHLLPHLNYPSLLSLRLAHPYFYHSPLLYPARAPAIRLRVAWLDDRAEGGAFLVPTRSGSLNFSTDAGFLANRQVQALLRREWQHADCRRGDAGCRVVLGMACGGPRQGGVLGKAKEMWRRIGWPAEGGQDSAGEVRYRNERRSLPRHLVGAMFLALAVLGCALSMALGRDLGWGFRRE